MKVKTIFTDKLNFETTLNLIGYENVLNIIPCTEYDTTLFMIICNSEKWEELQEKEECR